MKQLLEDYKRRLKTIEKMIKESPNNIKNNLDSKNKTLFYIGIDIDLARLKTKASCYRTFILELERELKNENNES